MFDDDLAERVERQLDTGPTRSVSRLAAPMFAAAARGRAAEVVVPVGRRVVVLAEFDLRADIAAARPDTPQVSRVLAVRQDGQWRWHPGTDEHFRAGDRIAVAATRSGMAAINQVLDEQS